MTPFFWAGDAVYRSPVVQSSSRLSNVRFGEMSCLQNSKVPQFFCEDMDVHTHSAFCMHMFRNMGLSSEVLGVAVSEVYSPPRITAEAQKQGLRSGKAYDLVTGFDLRLKAEEERPSAECFLALLKSDTQADVIAHIGTLAQHCKSGELAAADNPLAVALLGCPHDFHPSLTSYLGVHPTWLAYSSS